MSGGRIDMTEAIGLLANAKVIPGPLPPLEEAIPLLEEQFDRHMRNDHDMSGLNALALIIGLMREVLNNRQRIESLERAHDRQEGMTAQLAGALEAAKKADI